MIRNGENVEVYQWSTATATWQKIGDVVDAAGSNRRQIYDGREYDFVFDVDIQDGVPPLKLPYNAAGAYFRYSLLNSTNLLRQRILTLRLSGSYRRTICR